MKKYINRALLLSGCLLAFSACDENDWNDKLPGFEEGRPTDVQTISYTLTANDYSVLAANSTNKALAGESLADALKAVGSQGYFTDEITPQQYIPALLNDPKFPYFTLSNGSAIKVTYNVVAQMPEQIEQMSNAEKYTITEADYQSIWGSETDFVEAFAPAHKAAVSIPKILTANFPAAAADDYMIVTYNEASADPNFGASTDTPTEKGDGTAAHPYSAAEALEVATALTASDQVADVYVKGKVVSIKDLSTQYGNATYSIGDETTSFSIYRGYYLNGDKFTSEDQLKVGDEVVVCGTIVNYKGNTPQMTSGSKIISIEAAKGDGSEANPYSAAEALEVATALTESDQVADVYVKGKVVTITDLSTSYGNATYAIGDETTSFSIYRGMYFNGDKFTSEDQLKVGDEVVVKGTIVNYKGNTPQMTSKSQIVSINGKTSADAVASTASFFAMTSRASAFTVASEKLYAIYKFDGSAWALAPETVILNHADYVAMGQTRDNLSGTVPADYLPIFLKNKFPYAAIDAQEFVVYFYYNGTDTVTRVDQYTYNGSEWVLNNGVTTETSQFVRNNGTWVFDPSVVRDLYDRNDANKAFYQGMVDWVVANVPDGSAYVSSYGNNEVWSGANAYYCEFDIRTSEARKVAATPYADLSDAEITALQKERFAKTTMPGYLPIAYPDAKPVDGVKVLYTFTVNMYDGASKSETLVYEVTAPGIFTFVSATFLPEE